MNCTHGRVWSPVGTLHNTPLNVPFLLGASTRGSPKNTHTLGDRMAGIQEGHEHPTPAQSCTADPGTVGTVVGGDTELWEDGKAGEWHN